MPSTVIQFYNYYPETAELIIGFVSGMVYRYIDVPESTYLGLKQAYSKGSFFNNHIKEQYAFEKLE